MYNPHTTGGHNHNIRETNVLNLALKILHSKENCMSVWETRKEIIKCIDWLKVEENSPGTFKIVGKQKVWTRES